MNQPSPEIAWIGVIGGLVALARFAIDLVHMWRNRRRVAFHVISATQYYQVWSESDIKGPSMPVPGAPPVMKPGDWRRAFIVLEFAVKNDFPTDVSVGCFLIDDWLFADRYKKGDYAWKRDYRVFDLYSREPTSLDYYRKLNPKSVYGLRIEILEETSGPSWESSKSRYVLHLPRTYIVKFHRDTSTYRAKIRMPKATETFDFGFIHQWGDLLQQSKSHSGGAPLPQGWQYPKWRISRRLQLTSWIYRRRNRLLYGEPYPKHGQRHRLSRFIGSFRRRTSTSGAGTISSRPSDEMDEKG